MNSTQSIASGYGSSQSSQRRPTVQRRRMRSSRSSTPVSYRPRSQRRMHHSLEMTSPQWSRPPSQMNSNDITSAYATFGVQVARVLEKETSTDYVRMWLGLKFSLRDPAGCDMYNNLALYDDSLSLSQLLIKLNQYTSWFDYDHLASLARELGGQKGRKLVEEYEEKLSDHLRKNISQMPNAHEDAPEGFEEVEMKLDWDWEDTTGEDIVRFRETVSRLLHRPSSSILFKEAREGCVLLTLLVSCKLAPVVKQFAESNQLLLALHHILSIKVAGTLISIRVSCCSLSKIVFHCILFL